MHCVKRGQAEMAMLELTSQISRLPAAAAVFLSHSLSFVAVM